MSFKILGTRAFLLATLFCFQTACAPDSFYRDLATNDTLIKTGDGALTQAKVLSLLANGTVCIVYAKPSAGQVDEQLRSILTTAMSETDNSTKHLRDVAGVSILQPTGDDNIEHWYGDTLLSLKTIINEKSPQSPVTFFKIAKSDFLNRLKCNGQDGIIVSDQRVFFYHDVIPDGLITGAKLDTSNVILIVLGKQGGVRA